MYVCMYFANWLKTVKICRMESFARGFGKGKMDVGIWCERVGTGIRL